MDQLKQDIAKVVAPIIEGAKARAVGDPVEEYFKNHPFTELENKAIAAAIPGYFQMSGQERLKALSAIVEF